MSAVRRTTSRRIQYRKKRIGAQQRNNVRKSGEVLIDAPSRFKQMSVLVAARAARTIAVFGNLNAQGEGAEVRDLAKKIDGFLGVTAFEFTVGGAHAAKRADAA